MSRNLRQARIRSGLTGIFSARVQAPAENGALGVVICYQIQQPIERRCIKSQYLSVHQLTYLHIGKLNRRE